MKRMVYVKRNINWKDYAQKRAYKTQWQRNKRHGLVGAVSKVLGIHVRTNLLDGVLNG